MTLRAIGMTRRMKTLPVSLKGELALVTGSSSGIGLEIARELAKLGSDLIITARSIHILEDLKHELEKKFKVKVTVMSTDLSEPGAAKALYQKIRDQNLETSILVNNAGAGAFGAFFQIDYAKIEKVMWLNMLSLTDLTRCFLDDRIQSNKPGRILNVASTAAFVPGPYMAIYYASKAYVYSLSEALAEELSRSKHKVTLTTLCPGPTVTGFPKASGTDQSPLFATNIPIPSAKAVAQYGVHAMLQGRRTAVHGLANRLLTKLTPLIPVDWVVKVVSKINSPRVIKTHS